MPSPLSSFWRLSWGQALVGKRGIYWDPRRHGRLCAACGWSLPVLTCSPPPFPRLSLPPRASPRLGSVSLGQHFQSRV